jgi:hypothetical protein
MFVVFLAEGNNVDDVYGPFNIESAYRKVEEMLQSYNVTFCDIVKRAIEFDGEYLISPRQTDHPIRIIVRELKQ